MKTPVFSEFVFNSTKIERECSFIDLLGEKLMPSAPAGRDVIFVLLLLGTWEVKVKFQLKVHTWMMNWIVGERMTPLSTSVRNTIAAE